MSDLTCSGTEASLFICTSITPLGSVQNTTTCTHMDDVSVRCAGLTEGIVKILCISLIFSIAIGIPRTTGRDSGVVRRRCINIVSIIIRTWDSPDT